MLTIGRLFWGLLILTSWDDALSFSLSRIFFTFPKNQDISSFFSSVSTSIKHSPEFLSDLASLSGLDGSRLQPPTGGGGQLNHLSRGNDGWEKGLLTIPFLKSNDSSSRDFNLYLNAVEGNRSIRNQKAADRGLEAAIERWWERNTLGSKGLLVYLFPAVCSQLAVLRTAVPFFLDRLSQYLQPIYMGLSFLLLQKRGAGIIQATLWSSVLIGQSNHSTHPIFYPPFCLYRPLRCLSRE